MLGENSSNSNCFGSAVNFYKQSVSNNRVIYCSPHCDNFSAGSAVGMFLGFSIGAVGLATGAFDQSTALLIFLATISICGVLNLIGGCIVNNCSEPLPLANMTI